MALAPHSTRPADSPGESEQDQMPAGIAIEFREVSLLLPSGQVILDKISLCIPASSSVAIMGPSGCGKSSITNVLSGRAGYGCVVGEILINGSSSNSVAQLERVTGFVPQDDVMHRNLSVEENVQFQAELRMPREGNMDRKARGQQVETEVKCVLNRLGLGDPVLRCTLIGDEAQRGVSGGQRKRVSIAMEMVAKPKLLFLDEPTSGLDSTTSHSVVESFTQAAKTSECTTLAVIHQPRFETLELFSRVILLAAGGHLVYSGPVPGALDYFRQVLSLTFPPRGNPADILMDAVTLESAGRFMEAGDMLPICQEDKQAFGRALAELWQQRGAQVYGREGFSGASQVLPSLNFKTSTWGEEVFVQVQRASLQFKREWQAVLTNNCLLVLGLLCLCLGAPGKQASEDISHPMLALMLLMLTQGVAAQRIFGGAERPVGWREAASNASTVFYFAGRDLAALLDIVVGTLTFTVVYWPLSPLFTNFHSMLWVSFAFVYATWGISYVWSIVLPAGGAQMMVVVCAFMSQLVCGVQPAFTTLIDVLDDQGIYIMALSPIRWAHGALMGLHMVTGDSQFSNAMVRFLINDKLQELGMPLDFLKERGWKCKDSPWSKQPIKKRWLGKDADLPRPNSFVCSNKQLMLLGVLYRFVALLLLLIISRQKVRGGGRLVDTSDKKKVESGAGILVRSLVPIFFVAFMHLQMVLLLQTH